MEEGVASIRKQALKGRETRIELAVTLIRALLTRALSLPCSCTRAHHQALSPSTFEGEVKEMIPVFQLFGEC